MLALVLVLVAPHRAAAQASFSCDAACDALIVTMLVGASVVGAAFLVSGAALIGLGIDRAEDGYGLERGLAVWELIWGILETGGGVFVMSMSGSAEGVGIGLPVTGLGLYHLIHAVWSFTTGPPPRRRRAASSDFEDGETAPPQPSYDLTLTPLPSGMAVGVGGTF